MPNFLRPQHSLAIPVLFLVIAIAGCCPFRERGRRPESPQIVVLDDKYTTLTLSGGVFRHRSVVISYMDLSRMEHPNPGRSHIDVYCLPTGAVEIKFGPDTAEWIADPGTATATFLAESHVLTISGISTASGDATVELRKIGGTIAPIYTGTIAYSGYNPMLPGCSVDVNYTSTPYLSVLEVEYHGAVLDIPVGI
jgi:hypothetical protein